MGREYNAANIFGDEEEEESKGKGEDKVYIIYPGDKGENSKEGREKKSTEIYPQLIYLLKGNFTQIYKPYQT